MSFFFFFTFCFMFLIPSFFFYFFCLVHWLFISFPWWASDSIQHCTECFNKNRNQLDEIASHSFSLSLSLVFSSPFLFWSFSLALPLAPSSSYWWNKMRICLVEVYCKTSYGSQHMAAHNWLIKNAIPISSCWFDWTGQVIRAPWANFNAIFYVRVFRTRNCLSVQRTLSSTKRKNLCSEHSIWKHPPLNRASVRPSIQKGKRLLIGTSIVNCIDFLGPAHRAIILGGWFKWFQ